ncbi:hypothetical protein ACQU0X_27385 [Pseudovibrio ascidiaceicola]|uniref:hypothetical protein n=1 Tax=Pseudovibrio ascidiaceicola TaxID=285279 RepID=UPI003D366E71
MNSFKAKASVVSGSTGRVDVEATSAAKINLNIAVQGDEHRNTVEQPSLTPEALSEIIEQARSVFHLNCLEDHDDHETDNVSYALEGVTKALDVLGQLAATVPSKPAPKPTPEPSGSIPYSKFKASLGKARIHCPSVIPQLAECQDTAMAVLAARQMIEAHLVESEGVNWDCYQVAQDNAFKSFGATAQQLEKLIDYDS